MTIVQKLLVPLPRAWKVPPVITPQAPSREKNANVFSKLFFAWPFLLIRTAALRRLELDDFPLLHPDRTSEATSTRIRNAFRGACASGQRLPLLRSIEKACRFNLWLALTLEIIAQTADFANIITFYFFYHYLADDNSSFGRGVIWVSVLTATQALIILCQSHAKYRAQMVDAEVKTALVSLVSEKSFVIDPRIGDWDEGAILSVQNVHAERVSRACSATVSFVKATTELPYVIAVLGWLIGWIAVPAFLTIVLFMTIACAVTIKAMRARTEANALTDQRAGQIADMIRGIRLIKYYGWEDFIYQKIALIRAAEVKACCSSATWQSCQVALGIMGVLYGPLVASGTYNSFHVTLETPAIVLTGLLFLVVDRYLWLLYVSLVDLINAWPSNARMVAYLTSPDRAQQSDCVLLPGTSEASLEKHIPEKYALDVDATFAWGAHIAKGSFIAEIQLQVPHGQLVAVVGPSQSGKSSFLSGLIGSMTTRGHVSIDGLPSYCAQSAYIQSGTVQDNIVFGQRLDRAIYDRVIDVCALRADLSSFPRGDHSILGERGLNLSGGQKHRISLARAIYQALIDQRKIILLDDPLSAVDAGTSAILFDEAITRALQDKCRVLVTHQTHVLARCDRILFMQNGTIVADGRFEDLIKDVNFADFVGQHQQSLQVNHTVNDIATQDKDVVVVEEEERAAYGVPFSMYVRFIGGRKSRLRFLSIFALLVLSQTAFGLVNLQSAYWNSNKWNVSVAANACTMFGFILLHNLTWGPYAAFMQRFMITRANVVTLAALKSVLNAPMSFYDSNPAGRIIHRFTSDVSEIDVVLPAQFWDFTLIAVFLLATLIIALVYVPLVAVLLVPWFMSACLVFFIYQPTILETKRLSVNLRSKYMALLQEGLNGRSTISLARQETAFQETLCDKMDHYNSVNFLSIGAFQWATLATNLGYTVVVFCAGLLIVLQRFKYSPAVLTLVLGLLPTISSLAEFSLSTGAECQKGINAVERLNHYADDLPSEGQRSVGIKDWPANGQISFKDVCLRYKADLPLVLQNLSMEIAAGEKIGIVGRTGAGKTSLITALLRLTELSHGSISIDDMDLAKLGLHDVRHSIATIPQEPILFLGNVRDNLDPTGTIDDQRLQAALQQVHLELGLEDEVTAGGDNFSAGQRQLISLARALAKDCKIIMIDEATSNVDMAKDELIQKTIREVFADCTVLTIAHRLRTVLYYDRICVMDAGQVLEMGPPLALFKTGGRFYSLCHQAGLTEKDFE